ncbi:MAG: siroheme synthase CysG [Hyphomicrobiales bacterium]
MKHYPVYLDLEGRRALIVGGGEQAAQKLRLLLKTPARIDVVAPRANEEFTDQELLGRITIARRPFQASDVDGAALIHTAADPATNAEVAKAARERGIPVNAVDMPELCDFLTPAIVDRDPVTIAIGTGGAAPVLARRIKARLEAELPAGLGGLASRAGSLRDRIAAQVKDPGERRRLWERLVGGAYAARLLANDEAGADSVLEQEIAAARQGAGAAGHVALIGCGPGDPDLLTLRAQQRLQRADVLVIDRLVDPRVLEYARRDAARIPVGKIPGGPSASQEEINRILVREARAGKFVARLKGGDPFIFGRAGEEMAALARAGISHEVVPGITAAHACAASVGLPVTSRGSVRKFSVVTGATADGSLDHDWAALARDGQAFAVYMGVRAAGEIRARLLEAGMDRSTPVVLVENGTLPGERSFATTLDDLGALVEARGVSQPSVIYVGLDWAGMGLERPARVERFARARVTDFPRRKQPAPVRIAG